jgi:Tlde1 domain
MWTYVVNTGQMFHHGELIGTGYSGHELGLNNSDLEEHSNVGPIPRGNYTVSPFYHDPVKGPMAAHLIAEHPENMFGRYGFMIHGDNGKLDHSASHGCIVISRIVRMFMALSGDTKLEVI